MDASVDNKQKSSPSPSPSPNPKFGHLPLEPHYDGVNADLPDAFFNDIDPKHLYKKESYRHRWMISLAQEGMTIKEIAEVTDATVATVSNVLRQPHARIRMQSGMQKTLEQDLREIKDAVVKGALDRIIAISECEDRESVPAAVALKANESIVNRFLGTPVAHVQHEDITDMDKLSNEALERIAANGRCN